MRSDYGVRSLLAVARCPFSISLSKGHDRLGVGLHHLGQQPTAALADDSQESVIEPPFGVGAVRLELVANELILAMSLDQRHQHLGRVLIH